MPLPPLPFGSQLSAQLRSATALARAVGPRCAQRLSSGAQELLSSGWGRGGAGPRIEHPSTLQGSPLRVMLLNGSHICSHSADGKLTRIVLLSL